ncbi:hypothetical protein BDK51DRAFT_26743, partial [Blyttiomyces helicus]
VPTFNVSNFALSNNTNAFRIQQPTPANNSLSLAVDLSMLVSVKNPNLFTIPLHEVDVEAFLVVPGGNKTAIGKGSSSSLSFPSKSTSNFTLPFTLTYYSMDGAQAILADPALGVILNACGITNPAQTSNLNIAYTAKVSVPPLDTFGIRPSFDGRLDVACPLDAGMVTTLGQIIAQLAKGGNGAAAAAAAAAAFA